MNASDLARRFDHTVLAPECTSADLRRVAAEVIEHGMRGLCVSPCWVALGCDLLAGSGLPVISTVGFPFGTETSIVKAAQARELVRLGCGELDMVQQIGWLKEGRDEDVRDDIAAVVQAADGHPVKVILECGVLTEDEKRRACECAIDAGAAFVKTSTGFHSSAGGATVEDTRLLAEVVQGRVQVKASAGIRDLEQARALIDAGADVLGCSASVKILAELTSAH